MGWWRNVFLGVALAGTPAAGLAGGMVTGLNSDEFFEGQTTPLLDSDSSLRYGLASTMPAFHVPPKTVIIPDESKTLVYGSGDTQAVGPEFFEIQRQELEGIREYLEEVLGQLDKINAEGPQAQARFLQRNQQLVQEQIKKLKATVMDTANRCETFLQLPVGLHADPWTVQQILEQIQSSSCDCQPIAAVDSCSWPILTFRYLTGFGEGERNLSKDLCDTNCEPGLVLTITLGTWLAPALVASTAAGVAQALAFLITAPCRISCQLPKSEPRLHPAASSADLANYLKAHIIYINTNIQHLETLAGHRLDPS